MKILNQVKLAGVAALLVLFSVPAARDEGREHREGRGRWVRLGSAHVDGNQDHDNIQVDFRDGRFRAIQLRVRGGAVDFDRVVVHYEDGEPEVVAARERVRDGGATQVLDLRGNRRAIRSVELWYSKGGWRRRPEVRLFGLR